MFAIKVRTKHQEQNIFTWETFSSPHYTTDFTTDESGDLDNQYMTIEDEVGKFHTIWFEDNVAIFVENTEGKTIAKHNYSHDND